MQYCTHRRKISSSSQVEFHVKVPHGLWLAGWFIHVINVYSLLTDYLETWGKENIKKQQHNQIKIITLFPVYTHILVAGQASKVKQGHLTWSNQDNKYWSIKQNTGHVSVCSKSSLIFDNILSWWQSEQHREDGGWKKTQQLYWCNFQ